MEGRIIRQCECFNSKTSAARRTFALCECKSHMHLRKGTVHALHRSCMWPVRCVGQHGTIGTRRRKRKNCPTTRNGIIIRVGGLFLLLAGATILLPTVRPSPMLQQRVFPSFFLSLFLSFFFSFFLPSFLLSVLDMYMMNRFRFSNWISEELTTVFLDAPPRGEM